MSLTAGTLVVCGAVLEIGYRVLDPYPYIPPWEVNCTQHGNLSQYDPLLGWKGVPASRELFVTANARVVLQHNRHGFRDIEDEDRTPGAPAIVFLGDSFAWGYEVSWDELFVNRLRPRLEGFELFNLAHRGYGTDQSLLTFRNWHSDRRLALVVLVFYENDIWENNSLELYHKAKPKFAVIGGQLELLNVPVPPVAGWNEDRPRHSQPRSHGLAHLLLRSHAVHDLSYRLRTLGGRTRRPHRRSPDLELTARLLEALRDEVAARGADLWVVAVPTRHEIQERAIEPPYQQSIAAICATLEIAFLDLAPAFHAARLRTYFRDGVHWNPRGHRVAAEALWRGVDWPAA